MGSEMCIRDRVVLVFANHVDKLISCEFFLADHLEEGGYFVVGDLDILGMRF